MTLKSPSNQNYFLNRLYLMIPTFVAVTFIIYFLVFLMPGDPLQNKYFGTDYGLELNQSGLSQQANEYQIHSVSDFFSKYFRWLKNILTFEFGTSISYEVPVSEIIGQKFKNTLLLTIPAFLITYFLSTLFGLLKATTKSSRKETMTNSLLVGLYSLPPLLLGVLLIAFLSSEQFLNWFPQGQLQSDTFEDLTFWQKFLDRTWHLFLPVTSLVLGGLSPKIFLVSSLAKQELSKDYILVLKSKGLSSFEITFKHLLKNILPSLIVDFFFYFKFLVAGSVIIEAFFQLDGIGLLSYRSLLAKDIPVLMGLTVLTSAVILLSKIFSDLLILWVSPKVDFR